MPLKFRIFEKKQDGGGRHLKNHKNRDITDLCKVWYADAKFVP